MGAQVESRGQHVWPQSLSAERGTESRVEAAQGGPGVSRPCRSHPSRPAEPVVEAPPRLPCNQAILRAEIAQTQCLRPDTRAGALQCFLRWESPVPPGHRGTARGRLSTGLHTHAKARACTDAHVCAPTHVHAHVLSRAHTYVCAPSGAPACGPGAHVPWWPPPHSKPLAQWLRSRPPCGPQHSLLPIHERHPDTGRKATREGSRLRARPDISFPRSVEESEAQVPQPRPSCRSKGSTGACIQLREEQRVLGLWPH